MAPPRPACAFGSITKPVFDDVLQQYARRLPRTLRALDGTRYAMQPAAGPDGSGAHLTKAQVLTLVDWKLSRATFRPRLKQLVQSNADETVENTTRSAFGRLSGAHPTADGVKAAMTEHTALRGVGPATASLLMSVAAPQHVPFFSDELFRWALYEHAKGKGWDRPIRYTPQEYMELFARVQALTRRIHVSAVDVERVAYVLGRHASEQAPKSISGRGTKRRVDGEATVEATGPTKPSKPEPPTKKSKATSAEATPAPSAAPAKKPSVSKSTKGTKQPTRSSARVKARG